MAYPQEQLVFLRMRLSPHVVVSISFDGEGEVFQSDITRLEQFLALMKDTFHSPTVAMASADHPDAGAK